MDYLALALAAQNKGGSPAPTPPSPGDYPCLTFSSPSSFTLSKAVPSTAHRWEGVIEYSTDASTWNEFSDNTTVTSGQDGNEYKIYLRGMANTVVGGSSSSHALRLDGTQISCSGNIMTLLDCRSADAPNPAKTLRTSYTFGYLFYGCQGLISAPALPAETLADGCYKELFSGCSTLTTAPELPSVSTRPYCYQRMFKGCASLAAAPSLPATTLSDSCYYGMFDGCSSLVSAPALAVENLTNAPYCYREMFKGCASLAVAPALPATTLYASCYNAMFSECKALTATPALPATTLQSSCYESMFLGCTSLTTITSLPATTLASSCYRSMFSGCKALTTVPALPVTTLQSSCYDKMFNGCSNLTSLPELPSETLPSSCYNWMFYGASSIKMSETQTEECPNAYRIPSFGTGTAQSNSLTYMFYLTGGTFKGTPTINTKYYTNATIVPAT